jgi:hypothetical protein
VSVSFDLQSTSTDDLRRRLIAGKPMWVMWVIDVRRDVPFWFDLPVERGVLKVTTRRGQSASMFSVQRTLNGRSLGSPIDADLDQTYRHLTSFANAELQISAPVSAGAQYRLAIKAVVEGGGYPRIVTPWLAHAAIQR